MCACSVCVCVHLCGDVWCLYWYQHSSNLLLLPQTSIKMRQLCGQVMKDLIGGDVDVSNAYSHSLTLPCPVSSFVHVVMVKTACCFTTSASRPLWSLAPLSFPLLLQYDKVCKVTADAKFGEDQTLTAQLCPIVCLKCI